MSDTKRFTAAEAQAVCSFVQGGLVAKAYDLRDMVKLVGVEQPTDDAGVHLPYFVLQMASGLRIRVEVRPQEDDEA